MAINTVELCAKNMQPHVTGINKVANMPGRFAKIAVDEDIASKRGKFKKIKHSPYLNGDRIQLLSRLTEKRFIQNKNELYSSFPLASNIYRASSDEFKALKRNRRKAKKSVLTLPNVPAPIPQSCTVSDMNDSEYHKKSQKKRMSNQNRKVRIRTKGFEFYDRDADHINLDSSSTDMMGKYYNRDARNVINKLPTNTPSEDLTAQDVWAVLRNINKFQFRPSPRISETSLVMPKKKKIFLKRNRRLIETCRTQEIAYVANFEVQSKGTASPSSSFDRITVINKNELLKKPMNVEKVSFKNMNLQKTNNRPNNLIALKDKAKCIPRNFLRTLQFNNRNGLYNKNRRDGGKTLHDAIDEKVESACTIKQSVDSSNDFRKSDSDCFSSCTMKTKTLKHPKEIQEIIFSSPIDSNNADSVSSTEKMVKGKTRVVFQDLSAVTIGRFDVQKPKPRLVTTMPSAAAMPRLTTSDIKRRIAQIKFPLVILGKDQLSSTIEVYDYNPPQFRGLDEQIWPYMIEWTKKCGKNKAHSNNMQHFKKILPVDRITGNLRKVNNDLNVVKAKEKKECNVNATDKKKYDSNHGSPQGEDINVPLSPKKTKPIRQFKDKMLRLLYKKPSVQALEKSDEKVNIEPKQNKVEVKVEKVDVSTETPRPLSSDSYEILKRSPMKPDNLMIRKTKNPVCPPNSLRSVYNNRLSVARLPWAKAKWASDFIENVMKKITTGAYYYHESTYSLNYDTPEIADSSGHHSGKFEAGTYVDFNDVSVQTFNVSILSNTNERTDFKENVTEFSDDTLYDPLISIPGFDETLPELEIKTLNASQIAVKHRLSNVMVEFDITVPDKSSTHVLVDASSTLSSCIPLSVTSSHTKIFKCNTTILNAVLPAEICTVIPKVMRNIFNSETCLMIKTSVTDSRATISELSEYDSAVPSISTCGPDQSCTALSSVSNQWTGPQYTQWVYPHRNQWMNPLTDWSALLTNQSCTQMKQWENTPNAPWITNRLLTSPYGRPEYLHCLSPAVKEYMSGRFSSSNILVIKSRCSSIAKENPRITLPWYERNILPNVCIKSIMCCTVDPMNISDAKKVNVSPVDISSKFTRTPISNCTALLPCTGLQEPCISSSNFSTLLQNTWKYCKFNIHLEMPSYINPLQMIHDRNTLTINLQVRSDHGVEKKMTVTVSNLKIDSLYDRLTKIYEDKHSYLTNNASPTKCIEYPEKTAMLKTGKKNSPAKKRQEKLRKKGYVNLYKKCKSTSNISTEKQSTSLSKITNLDEFFQALGSAKVLSSVFDECAGNKVLTCVRDMSKWVKDITPRQALLLLLLTNKKDTANLVQFRPVILQGIAVNRITRATELDMEIEVIEREDIKIPQYEGISYIPASVDNQDNLLEELCWIAKTTASDYQRPFDDSSQRLLKSLLEKRKKLNPSYLRVMARYVGLGLLKTPVKHFKKYAT